MGLIHIKRIGYGISGNMLDLVIAIPNGRYIENFWVANQNDIDETSNTKTGLEYIQGCIDASVASTKIGAFNVVFNYLPGQDYIENGVLYKVYELNQYCNFKFNKSSSVGIFVSPNNLNFITLQINKVSGGYGYGYAGNSCILHPGEDCTTKVVPLYNINALRKYALSFAKFPCCPCDTHEDFIDKILQIKTIQLCLHTKDYYKASFFWNKFFKNKHIVTNSK